MQKMVKVLKIHVNQTFNVFVGYHSRWNGVVGVRHPNIWIFLRKLIDEEKHCRHTLRTVERGEASPTRQRRYRILQKKIHRLKRDYRAGRKNVSQYWKAMSYLVHQYN